MMYRSYSNISKYFLRDYVTIAMVIILVTMATPISSHVKDKNSMFTAGDEDMIFLVKGEILVFYSCLCNKYVIFQIHSLAASRCFCFMILGPVLLANH